LELFRRFALWQLTPVLLSGLWNVLVWYYLGQLSALVFVAVIAGLVTPDGFLCFTAICLSIPALVGPNYHGALIYHLLVPLNWAYFVVSFTPLYVAYLGSVRFGMIMRNAVMAFRAGYSGLR
jgi:hypothetical protein